MNRGAKKEEREMGSLEVKKKRKDKGRTTQQCGVVGICAKRKPLRKEGKKEAK